jgi:LacI family transcriptional regulator
MAAFEEAGRSAVCPTHTPFTYEGGQSAARLLLARRVPPTAVMVSCDVQAIGVLSASCGARHADFEGLPLVSVDGTHAAAYANSAITTLSQPVERMARRAVATIVARDGEPVRVVRCGSLMLRRSCGC